MQKPFRDVVVHEVFGAHGTFWVKTSHSGAKDLRRTNGYGTCDFLEKGNNTVVEVVDGDGLVSALKSLVDVQAEKNA